MKTLKQHILAIDDDEVIQNFLKKRLTPDGYEITTVSTAEAAIHRLASSEVYDLILSDLLMPRMNGLELLAELKSKNCEIPLILMTAHGSLETAVEAMRNGAFDYILKPLNLDELKLSIDKALKFRKLEEDNSALRNQIKQSWTTHNIIGKSQSIQTVFELVARVAPTQANVLITGESGTGKEVIARSLHFQSSRKDGPFIAINCSAIPGELLESELFGHAKGSFTGAYQTKKGLFEEAQNGTVFLDEIGDMELALQAKLLRVLQERKVKPVGENQTRSIDVRIIAATHKNLRTAIQEGRFREDLYYRLCVIPIEIPPLRQRKEDIPLLAEHFLKKHTATHGLGVLGFTTEAMAKLIRHPWRGNVRELENVIERSVILARSQRISASDLPDFDNELSPISLLEEKSSQWMSLQDVEKHYIDLILRKTGGKKERTAHILGIDRKTLRRKEQEYGLSAHLETEDQTLDRIESPTEEDSQEKRAPVLQ